MPLQMIVCWISQWSSSGLGLNVFSNWFHKHGETHRTRRVVYTVHTYYIILVFVFFSQKRWENKVQSIKKKRKQQGKSCSLYCRAVCTTRNFYVPKNPRFIIESGFKSRAVYDGSCTVVGTQNMQYEDYQSTLSKRRCLKMRFYK